MTARFVDAVAGTKAVILDTRKTTPGWRALEKYAVRCGGGRNHRFGLYDAVLIKDNHLAWLAEAGEPDPIGAAVGRGAGAGPGRTVVEVEVDSLEQLDRALECGPDIILVDNIGPDGLAEAVRRRDERAPGVLLEASGGVSLATVAALARTGVDRISVGALTHSAPALDIGLDFDRSPAAVNIALLRRLREAGGGFVPVDELGPEPRRVARRPRRAAGVRVRDRAPPVPGGGLPRAGRAALPGPDRVPSSARDGSAGGSRSGTGWRAPTTSPRGPRRRRPTRGSSSSPRSRSAGPGPSRADLDGARRGRRS